VSAQSASALPPESTDSAAATLAGALERVRRALSGLRFGTVTLQVQDGVVVLIERVEKVRITSGGPAV